MIGGGRTAIVSFSSASAADIAEVVQDELPNCNVAREVEMYAIALQAISIGSHHLFVFSDQSVR